MNQIQQQQLKRRISNTVADIDQLQAQLAEIRNYCAQLATNMRKVREDAIRAQQLAAQQQDLQRRRNRLKIVS